MSKIKILHILHAVGGVDVHLRILLKNLDHKKFEFIVIHGEKDTEEPFLDDEGKPVKSYRVPIVRQINPVSDSKAFAQVDRIIKREQPQLIHAHSAKAGVIAKCCGRKNKIPVLHTPHAYSYLSAENVLKKKLFFKIEKFFSSFNSKIVACSESERQRAITEVGYKPDDALLFNNSIEPIKQTKPLSINKTWPDEYICSVGRPSYQKNIELMVEVIRELKQEKSAIHLVLMGVGFHAPNLEKVKNLIEDYQLQQNITLLEWTAREDIFNIISNSKLYISTSRYEGLPYSIIESMALKKVIVATDADGNRDLVENGNNGFIIENENVESFKNAVLKLLENDSLRKNFEENSFEKFNSNFNIRNTIGNLESIYLENAISRQQ